VSRERRWRWRGVVESHSAGRRLEATPSIVVPAHGRETTRGGSFSPLCAMTIDYTPPPPPPLAHRAPPPTLSRTAHVVPASPTLRRTNTSISKTCIQTHSNALHSNTFKHRHEAVDCVATAPVTAAQCNCKPRQLSVSREDLTLFTHYGNNKR
jgi:hypothetical protein